MAAPTPAGPATPERSDVGQALLDGARGALGASLVLVVTWSSDDAARVHGASPGPSPVPTVPLPRALAHAGGGLHVECPVRADWFRTSALSVEHGCATPDALAVVAARPGAEDPHAAAALLAVWEPGAGRGRDLATAVAALRAMLEATVRAVLVLAAERKARARLDALLAAVPEAIVLTDDEDGTALLNEAAAALIGVPAGVIPAATLAGGMRALQARCVDPAGLAVEGRTLFRSRGASRAGWAWEVVAPEPRALQVTTVPVRAGSHHGRLWAFQDVTQLAAQQQALRALAERDALTGILNRRGFTQAVAVARDHRTTVRGCPVLLTIDLDGFKPINDAHGHAAGDEALRAVAAMLLEVVRGTDAVGRLGGDEFAVFLADIETHANLRRVLDRLSAVRDAHNASAALAGRPFAIGWSVGAVFAEPGEALEAMLARADAAMYAHKRRAGVPVRVARPTVQERVALTAGPVACR